MPTGIHWADRQIPGPLFTWAPPCSKEQRHGSSSNCWAWLFSQPPGWSLQGHGDQCTPSHPDTLYAGFLAYSVPPGHPQQRKVHHARRTLYFTAGLNIAILFSFFLFSFFFVFFLLFVLFICIVLFQILHPFLACCTRVPHVTTSLFVCPVCIYTSLPVSVNNSLRKAAIGCRNVWWSCDLASVSTSSTVWVFLATQAFIILLLKLCLVILTLCCYSCGLQCLITFAVVCAGNLFLGKGCGVIGNSSMYTHYGNSIEFNMWLLATLFL